MAVHIHEHPQFRSFDGIKPPLGVCPRHIYEAHAAHERVTSLLEAMMRYTNAWMKIPSSWVDELRDLAVYAGI